MATKLKTVEQELEAIDAARERNIAQRLNAVMAEVEYVQKEKPKSGMQYSYVSHDAVTKLVRPILQAHGVIYYPRNLQVSQNGNRTEAIFVVRFENIDDRTDYIDVETIGYGVDNQDKGPGKAMSYGVKYALLKALGLETGDDPEAVQDNSADHKPAARPSEGVSRPANGDAPFPLGPAKNKTELKAKGREFWREVESSADPDEFECLLTSHVALVKQLIEALPSWWDGGTRNGEPFEGLEAVIARKRKEFEQENVG